jgi:hypothetical protein
MRKLMVLNSEEVLTLHYLFRTITKVLNNGLTKENTRDLSILLIDLGDILEKFKK